MARPLPSALLHLPICLGRVFFSLSHASDGQVSGALTWQMGGETVPQACRAVAGYAWMTADAREAWCRVAVDARGAKTDALPRTR